MEPKMGPKHENLDLILFFAAHLRWDGPSSPLPAMYETTPADRKVKSQTTYFISYTKNAMC